MSDDWKVLQRPLFRRDISWNPVHEWAEPSRMFEQRFSIPPFLEPGDLSWIDWAKRRLASSSWPGYAHSPVSSPSAARPPAAAQESPRLEGQLTGGVSEIRTGQDSWKISLDVKQFSPEEITILIKGGFLEIAGKHEDRQDEKGTVSRCFTRKYRLPQGVNMQHISCSLSGDGLLCVEAPIPGTPVTSSPSSSEIVTPVLMKQEQVAAK